MTEEGEGLVSWNLGQSIIMELSALLQRANGLYLKGKIVKWFFTLKAIKFRIIPKLSEEERKTLTKQEYMIRRAKFKDIRVSYIERYNEMIMDLLKKKGFYPKDLEDSSDLN